MSGKGKLRKEFGHLFGAYFNIQVLAIAKDILQSLVKDSLYDGFKNVTTLCNFSLSSDDTKVKQMVGSKSWINEVCVLLKTFYYY